MSITQQAKFKVRDGPRVRIRVHLSRAELRTRRMARQPIPGPLEMWALIDTGAECSCVDAAVVRRLELPPYKTTFANAPGLGGLGFAPLREAALTLLHPSRDPNLNLVFSALSVTELDLGILGYDALIGRDILARCVLTYNGPAGSFTLSY